MIKQSKITIREPYWSAGDRYGWTKDGYSRAGIGLNTKYLKDTKYYKSGEFVLSIDIDHGSYKGKHFILDVQKAVQFILTYKSVHIARGVTLGEISVDLLEEIYEQEI